PPDNIEADVVFHTSATGDGLTAAIAACAFEARLIEMSWFGTKTPEIPLGGAFHRKRLRIVSSQVGHVSDSCRARWTHQRRLAKALELLDQPGLDALLTCELPFDDAPHLLADLLASDANNLAPVLTYAQPHADDLPGT
ncbi:MAG: dehydrogenase, partial [Pseudomonadota bacterium]